MNYLAESSRYQNQDRPDSYQGYKNQDTRPLSWLLVLAFWFYASRDYLDATPEAEPWGILIIKHKW